MKTKGNTILTVVIIGGVIALANNPVFVMEHVLNPGQLIIYLIALMIYLSITNYQDKQKKKETVASLKDYIGDSNTFDIAQSFKKKRIKSLKK